MTDEEKKRIEDLAAFLDAKYANYSLCVEGRCGCAAMADRCASRYTVLFNASRSLRKLLGVL